MGAIASCLGERNEISSLEVFCNKREVLSHLLSNGLEYFLSSDLSPAQLATSSVKQTLEFSGLESRQIDGVIYVSSTFADVAQRTVEIGQFCVDTGLQNVPPIGLYLAECGTYATAVKIARSFLESGRYKNLLVVTTDKASSENHRLLDGNLSVSGDAAASCIFSTDDKFNADFELLNVVQNTDQQLWGVDMSTNYTLFAKLFAEGVAKTFVETFNGVEELKLKKPDVLVTNNYILEVLGMFAQLAGMDYEQLYTRNLSKMGHLFTADNLVNLQTLLSEGAIKEGQLIATLSTGVCTWGGTVLKAID